MTGERTGGSPRRLGVASILGAALVAACGTAGPFYATDAPGPPPSPDTSQVRQRILLIGDTGEPFLENGDTVAVLGLLKRTAAEIQDRTAVVFLGDNIYPDGMHPDTGAVAARNDSILDVQLAALDTLSRAAKGIFVPGNHDWADGDSRHGLAAIQRQGTALASRRPGLDVWLRPDTVGGCPGPEAEDLDGVRIVTLDTQWWLQEGTRRHRPCESVTEEEVTDSLGALLRSAGERKVLVVGHHPLYTVGPHGRTRWWGFLNPQAYMDPGAWWARIPSAPIVGGAAGWAIEEEEGALIGAVVASLIYPAVRRLFGDQDVWSGKYKNFRSQIEGVLTERRPLLYAAGHDHSLQVHQRADIARYEVVSGLGSDGKIKPVSKSGPTLFAHAEPGFMALDFMRDGGVLLRVVEPGREVPYWTWLRER